MAPGIETATSCSAVRRSTDLANPAAVCHVYLKCYIFVLIVTITICISVQENGGSSR